METMIQPTADGPRQNSRPETGSTGTYFSPTAEKVLRSLSGPSASEYLANLLGIESTADGTLTEPSQVLRSESGPEASKELSKPLVIDIFAGSFGWSAGFIAEGYRAIGFDILHESYHGPIPPGCTLVLQNALTLNGAQFRNAAVIVASPPCQRYSYMAMPWTRAKALIAWHRESPERIRDLNALFDACFRIQLEASKSAGRYIPMVVENVKGAQPWVGRAKAHFGSFFLWGDVAMHGDKLVIGQSWLRAPKRLLKQAGRNFHFPEKYGIPSPSFHGAEHEPSVAHATGLNLPGNNSPRLWKDREIQRLNDAPKSEGVKVALSGRAWFAEGLGKVSSKSDSRKAASAQIAKIPFPLSQWIARCYHP